IVLGVEETSGGGFRAIGLVDSAQVERDLWSNLGNTNKVNANLLSESSISRDDVGDGRTVLVIKIPRADRSHRPIFINGNPLTGTYRRLNDGDHKCSATEVQRMLADASTTQTRDAIILENFTVDDLDPDSIRTYRNLLSSHNPNHPFLQSDDAQLLKQAKVISVNRENGNTGITVAGLLMFGKNHAIRDYYPQFFLDYRELPHERERITDERWLDRVTPDGTWAGNLLTFYLRVLPKLTAGLRVPYQTNMDLLRTEETRVHTALKEALLNSLVHADYGDSKGVRIFRSTNKFEFYNPGVLLIDPDSLDGGGRSESRNPLLQDMFRLIGIGERAGSGVPAIIRAWKEQQWQYPILEDDVSHCETRLVLNTINLFPPEVVSRLTERFGNRFSALTETQRLALCLAASDGGVTNRQVQKLSDEHGRDITYILRDLVSSGFLIPHGEKQGRRYSISDSQIEIAPYDNTSSEQSAERSEQSSVEVVTLAEQVRTKQRAAKDLVQRAILEVCGAAGPLTLDAIAQTLNRAPETLRVHYISKLVADGALVLAYPDRPNHPQQAYKTP
ncbi:MAG: ATP-binding protein, partial [Pseudobdellovibrionaceae bacterium]